MPAELFGAAVFDSFHSFAVGGQHAVAIFFTIRWAMNPEDVGQLDFMVLLIKVILREQVLKDPP